MHVEVTQATKPTNPNSHALYTNQRTCMCDWRPCLHDLQWEYNGCMPLKSLQKKEIQIKNQGTSDYSLGHYTTVLAVVLSLLSHKSVFSKTTYFFCVNTGHANVSTIVKITVSIRLFSDCELSATELPLWSL